jgi:hypothetical protein
MRNQRSLGSAMAFAFTLLTSLAPVAEAEAQAAPVYPPAAEAPGARVAPPPVAPGQPVTQPSAAPQPAPDNAGLLRARREQARTAREERSTQKAQRRAQRAEQLASGAHRLSVSLGFSPTIVARELPGGKPRARDVAAFRQRTVELGLAYTHDVSGWLGVRAGAAFGLGVTHLDFAADGGDCCSDAHARVDPSYSLTLDAAPVFQVARIGFYAAPGLALRMFFLPENSRVMTAETDDLSVRGQTTTVSRLVSFKSPALTLGFRPAFGFRFGPERRVDVNFGADLGFGLRNADVSLGMFVRAGYAFVSLARR